MATVLPPLRAEREFLGPTTRHTRRIEIYEQDAITRWPKDQVRRLIEGSVSVDYDRDERRSGSLTLSNTDGVLINDPGEFWYDKIIKIFRGVKINDAEHLPRVLIIGDYLDEARTLSGAFREALVEAGFDDVQINTQATLYSEVIDFDVIVSLGDATSIQIGLLAEAYRDGKSVYVQDIDASVFLRTLNPTVPISSFGESIIAPIELSTHPAAKGWGAFEVPGTEDDILNLIVDPRGVSRYGPATNLTFQASGGPTGIPTWVKLGNTATGTGSFRIISQSSTDRFPVTSGESYTASAFLYHTHTPNERVSVYMNWYDENGTYLSQTVPIITPGANGQWYEVRAQIVVPDNAYSAVMGASIGRDTGWPSSAYVGATGFMLTDDSTVDTARSYFDGSTIGDDVYEYIWLGAANASRSVRLHRASIAADLAGVPNATQISRVQGSFVEDVTEEGEESPEDEGDEDDPDNPPDEEISPYSRIAALVDPVNQGRAVVLMLPFSTDTYDIPEVKDMLRSMFSWLDTVVPLGSWETQIGEFMIERISESNFPHEVKITLRDYTKKCMASKFVAATQFSAGMSPETVIASIAGAAGITKRNLPTTGIAMERTFYFDRGTTRWDAMKEIASAYDHEIYFDPQGYLVMRKYADPAETSPSLWVYTGDGGQLASYEKSTTDSRLYNVVVVTGESSDATTPPVYAVARNDNEDSPTGTSNIGERVYQYTSSFITTAAQAQQVADSFLLVHSLEEFELSFDSLMMPWLEVGDIIGWEDPDRASGDPQTFLLSTISIPLDLGPMSASARRVTIVS